MLWGAATLVLTLACKPNLGSPPSIVDGLRILAVRGLPAEAAEGTSVTYDVLAADEMGRVANPTLGWYQCDQRKPPAEGNAVAAACLSTDTMETTSATFTAILPAGACKRFGPQTDVDKNNVSLRPNDPDVTGGFYQPVRARLTKDGAESLAFALERIKCPLTNTPSDAAGMFNATYKLNVNPTIASLTLDPDGQPAPIYTRAANAPAPSPPTTAVTWVGSSAGFDLELAWSADSPESFPVWNPTTQTIDTHREAMSVSWYATDGSFLHDRTGRGEMEMDLTTRNRWVAPLVTASTLVHFWIVLRDSRGGIDFSESLVEVRP